MNWLDRLRSFLAELKRRNVYRVAATYAVVGFVVLQVADLTFVRLGLPPWTVTFVIVLVALGFPVALVLAWAFEMTPEGVRRTPRTEGRGASAPAHDAGSPAAADAPGSSGSPESTEAARQRSRRAGTALVALGLLGLALAGGWYLVGGGGESPEVAEGTVAVLPFQVGSSADSVLRDGMVSLLSNGLDEAGELRAIPHWTVLARWDSAGMTAGAASTEERLSVARGLGAEHAVIGSAAVVPGGDLQLIADVHATGSGERLERVEFSGSPDGVSSLVRELNRNVIAVLAAETGVSLRATELTLTQSVDALKLYLSGLEHERAGEYEPAVEDYEAAIERDSAFALPYARLGLIGLWWHDSNEQAMRRAFELADSLPERKRRLVRALHLGRVEHRTLAAADSLRRLSRDYPDDPSVWFALGDLVYHAVIPDGLREVEEAHGEAVRLDPGNAPYHLHYMGAAFSLHHDSALAARRVEALPASTGARRMSRLGLQVVFGAPEIRRRALARYDTVSLPAAGAGLGFLAGPEDTEHLDEVLRRLMERHDLDPNTFVPALLHNDLRRGRPDRFVRDLRRWETEEAGVACHLLYAAATDIPLPDSLERSYLDPENLPSEPLLEHLACSASYGLDRGDMDGVDHVLEVLRTRQRDASPPSPEREAVLQEIRGFRAWKEGDLERAVGLLSRSNESNVEGALWRGDLYRELGRLETAEGWYRVAVFTPAAYERLGRLYEEMARPGDAAAAYRRFVAAWEDADARLQPRVEEARDRIRRLAEEGGEPGG